MGLFELLMVLMVAGSVGFIVALVGRWATRNLGGSSQHARLERLEAELKRLAPQEAPQDLDDEVRRLDERVEFLEALLAERPKASALPAGSGGEADKDDDM